MAQQIIPFRELRVYQFATELQQVVFQASKIWPRDEKISLTDQARRSSRSVGANVAESWAKRNYPSHFISKLTNDVRAGKILTRYLIHLASDFRIL